MTQCGFGNTEFFQQKKQIVERFRAIVPKLKALDQNVFYKEAVQGFQDALASTTYDLGRLPVYSSTGLSLTKSKSNCVLCLLSKFVQCYWYFCIRQDNETLLESDLWKQLENIAEKGLDAFEIKKNIGLGYYLVEKE